MMKNCPDITLDPYHHLCIEILSAQSALMQRLQYLHQLDPDAYFAAGVIRNTIWSFLHDKEFEISNTEIDVIFYQKDEKDHKTEKELTQKLSEMFPENDWDVANQAQVHTWYKTLEGASIAPILSIEHALSLWVETATAIAIRIDHQGLLEIVAPFGLEDLFQLKLRWNKNLVSYAAFEQRMAKKQFLKRFPKLKVIDS